MTLPGRTHSSPTYRYGFQGQEKDDELKGEGNSLNYTFRMHDPRVGRFFAVDPLAPIYSWNSPYAFSENRVLHMIELEGMEGDDFRFRQWQLSQGGIQAKAAQAEREVVRKAINGMKEKIIATNRYAEGLVRMRDEGNVRLAQMGEEPVIMPTWQIYFHAYFRVLGPYSDAEDISVIFDGRTIEGNEAGIFDYALAGIGVFAPFVSGGAIKKLFKSPVDEFTEKVIKLDDGKVLNLTTKGDDFAGEIALSDNSGVIFDANFKVSDSGKDLTLDKIGFYQHIDGNILGSEGQNTLGNLTFEVLGQIKAQAKSEGFETLTLKYKRALYDNAGKPILDSAGKQAFGPDAIKQIKL